MHKKPRIWFDSGSNRADSNLSSANELSEAFITLFFVGKFLFNGLASLLDESPDSVPSPKKVDILQIPQGVAGENLPYRKWRMLGIYEGKRVTVTAVSRTEERAKRLAEVKGIVVSDILLIDD